ncbi:hypothetical protein Ppa06_51190 [Planomonospora parontospora subsp. parontospora]|uniref:Uncharacterized protein n=2 Tax=Planomonospora parontospora TaxID=58119 RepID=A0AA37BJE8_9ACTN|nr:hypothetical protein GCM10010126_44580 [Planomonospora parontospora]GII11321.1 hypothetical protein Ppa06_51190 [Planomonospora parontospora subsp. parontospora]
MGRSRFPTLPAGQQAADPAMRPPPGSGAGPFTEHMAPSGAAPRRSLWNAAPSVPRVGIDRFHGPSYPPLSPYEPGWPLHPLGTDLSRPLVADGSTLVKWDTPEADEQYE